MSGKPHALEQMEQQLRVMREAVEATQADPGFGEKLIDAIRDRLRAAGSANRSNAQRPSVKQANSSRQSSLPPRKNSHADRMIQWFGETGNTWATVKDVSGRLDINENSVHHIVHTSYPHYFESRENPKNPRANQYRLSRGIGAQNERSTHDK